MKEDLHHAHTIHGLRLHVFNVVDGSSEAALDRRNDALGHLFGGDAVVVPDHIDDGHADLGEDVGRHSDDRKPAGERDHQRHYDEGIGAPQRQTDNPHEVWANSS
jgi:hypothetical protein